MWISSLLSVGNILKKNVSEVKEDFERRKEMKKLVVGSSQELL